MKNGIKFALTAYLMWNAVYILDRVVGRLLYARKEVIIDWTSKKIEEIMLGER